MSKYKHLNHAIHSIRHAICSSMRFQCGGQLANHNNFTNSPSSLLEHILQVKLEAQRAEGTTEGACLEGRLLLLFAAGQVEGEDDLGDDGVGVGGVGGGRGGGGLPGAGDDRGALHEPHRAVGPRRLQVLGFLAHRVVPPSSRRRGAIPDPQAQGPRCSSEVRTGRRGERRR